MKNYIQTITHPSSAVNQKQNKSQRSLLCRHSLYQAELSNSAFIRNLSFDSDILRSEYELEQIFRKFSGQLYFNRDFNRSHVPLEDLSAGEKRTIEIILRLNVTGNLRITDRRFASTLKKIYKNKRKLSSETVYINRHLMSLKNKNIIDVTGADYKIRFHKNGKYKKIKKRPYLYDDENKIERKGTYVEVRPYDIYQDPKTLKIRPSVLRDIYSSSVKGLQVAKTRLRNEMRSFTHKLRDKASGDKLIILSRHGIETNINNLLDYSLNMIIEGIIKYEKRNNRLEKKAIRQEYFIKHPYKAWKGYFITNPGKYLEKIMDSLYGKLYDTS